MANEERHRCRPTIRPQTRASAARANRPLVLRRGLDVICTLHNPFKSTSSRFTTPVPAHKVHHTAASGRAQGPSGSQPEHARAPQPAGKGDKQPTSATPPDAQRPRHRPTTRQPRRRPQHPTRTHAPPRRPRLSAVGVAGGGVEGLVAVKVSQESRGQHAIHRRRRAGELAATRGQVLGRVPDELHA